MPSIQTYSKFIILYNSSIYLFSPSDGPDCIKTVNANDVVSLKLHDPTNANIDTLQVSPCGQFVAITVQKELVLLSFPQLHVLSNIAIEKTAFSLKFFNNLKILLVADKSGSVLFFSFDGTLKKKCMRLGHNSMLTDALVSKGDNHIITADRDEKIRITCFPNVYNIHNYCLGHEKFVSSLCWVPTDRRLLASASGDGTIRIWDFLNGVQLCKYEANTVRDDAIVKIICCEIDNKCCMAVQKYKTHEIAILSLSDSSEEGFYIIPKHTIITSSIVIDITFYNETLLYLLDDDKVPLNAWPEQLNIPILSTAVWERTDMNNFDTHKVLFKRYFDNVQDYHEKKKARLMAKKQSLIK